MNFIFDFWIWSVLPGIILVPKKKIQTLYIVILLLSDLNYLLKKNNNNKQKQCRELTTVEVHPVGYPG